MVICGDGPPVIAHSRSHGVRWLPARIAVLLVGPYFALEVVRMLLTHPEEVSTSSFLQSGCSFSASKIDGSINSINSLLLGGDGNGAPGLC